MSEFNPTKKDLLNLDSRILDIKSKKQGLIQKKISLQDQLGSLNDIYKQVVYKSDEFNAVKNKRAKLKAQYNEIELKIQSLNEELSFKNKLRLEVEFHLKNNKPVTGNEEIDQINNKIAILKKRYSDFSKDRTRISSLRVMASEFISDLEWLIKN